MKMARPLSIFSGALWLYFAALCSRAVWKVFPSVPLGGILAVVSLKDFATLS